MMLLSPFECRSRHLDPLGTIEAQTRCAYAYGQIFSVHQQSLSHRPKSCTHNTNGQWNCDQLTILTARAHRMRIYGRTRAHIFQALFFEIPSFPSHSRDWRLGLRETLHSGAIGSNYFMWFNPLMKLVGP